MGKIIYHGSQSRLEQPVFGAGKRHNDYGLGFYCTESPDLAREWAVDFKRDGYANQYLLKEENLKILSLNEASYCTLHWLALLLENRRFDVSSGLSRASKRYILENFLLDISEYDIVIGYRADDSYFSFAQDFINGTISYRQLNNAMHLGQLGEQVVLKTEKVFRSLEFIGAEYVLADEWYVKKAARDASARNEYFSAERSAYRKGDLYMPQILDEEINADDARLQ